MGTHISPWQSTSLPQVVPELGQKKEEKEGEQNPTEGTPRAPGEGRQGRTDPEPNPPGEASPTRAGPGGEEVSPLTKAVQP